MITNYISDAMRMSFVDFASMYPSRTIVTRPQGRGRLIMYGTPQMNDNHFWDILKEHSEFRYKPRKKITNWKKVIKDVQNKQNNFKEM